MVVQSVAAHGAVTAAPVGGDDASAAVDVDDLPMAESDEVVDDLTHAVVVRGAYDVECGAGDPAADGDDGSLATGPARDQRRPWRRSARLRGGSGRAASARSSCSRTRRS